MKTPELVVCYHHRPERIEVGCDIPHTVVPDPNIPEELQRLPLVWFIIANPNKPDNSGFYPTHSPLKTNLPKL